MKTSDNQPTQPPPAPAVGEHWSEMTASLATDSVESFGQWIADDLRELEELHAGFVSANSLMGSLRR